MTYDEMIRLLKTAERPEDIDLHREEIARIIPKVRVMFGYDQKNHAHQFDLWMHCLNTVTNLPRGLSDDMLYLAAMVHDIGKPYCQVHGKREGDTSMHYYGHPVFCKAVLVNEIIPQLLSRGVRLSDDEKKRLIYYVEYHDDNMSLKLKSVERHHSMVSLPVFKNLMLLQVADAKAHVQLPIIAERVRICTRLAGRDGEEFWHELDSQP